MIEVRAEHALKKCQCHRSQMEGAQSNARELAEEGVQLKRDMEKAQHEEKETRAPKPGGPQLHPPPTASPPGVTAEPPVKSRKGVTEDLQELLQAAQDVEVEDEAQENSGKKRWRGSKDNKRSLKPPKQKQRRQSQQRKAKEMS